MIQKQDRIDPRKLSDLERKYNFKKRFAEVNGSIESARGEADRNLNDLNRKMDQQEIFSRLTNGGKAKAMYMDEDGDIFVNASYLAAGILASLDKSTFFLDIANNVLKGRFDELIMEGKLDMNGQKLGGLMEPEEPGEAANKKYVDNARFVRNLLDNSDFTNPVNQRGAATYNVSISSGNYCIDRWMLRNANFDVATREITANSGPPYMGQSLDSRDLLLGKTLTIALMVESGSGEFALTDGTKPIYWGNYLSPAIKFDGAGLYVASFTMPNAYVNTNTSFIIRSTVEYSFKIKWAALYEGEYTAETLPPYVPKGYAAELAECQRYFYKINSTTNQGFGCSANSGKNALISIITPVPMRIKPSIKVSNYGYIRGGGNSKLITGITVEDVNSNIIDLVAAVDSVAVGLAVVMINTNFELSADL